jgi:hypothetical protein
MNESDATRTFSWIGAMVLLHRSVISGPQASTIRRGHAKASA